MMILCHAFLKSYLLKTCYRPSTNGLYRGFASATAGRGCARALENGRRLSRPHTEHHMLLSHFYMFEILHNKKWKGKNTALSRQTPHSTPGSQLNSRFILASPANFSLKHVASVNAAPSWTLWKGNPPLWVLPPLHTRALKSFCGMRGFKTFDPNFEMIPIL